MIYENMPLISVIIPVYNVDKYLRECLDSVANQTYKNLQIICVNDGSADNSPKILEEYAARDNRFLILNQKNSGASAARNNALSFIEGEYLMFIDADDWIDPETCEYALKKAVNNRAEVVFWSYMKEYGDKSVPKHIYDEDEIVFDEQAVKEKLHRRFFGLYKDELAHPENSDAIVTIWGKLYRTDVVKKSNAKFIDMKIVGTCEDGCFNIEIFKYVKKAVFVNKSFYHYRKDNIGSQTTGYRANLFELWNNLYDTMQKYIGDNSYDNTYQISLYNRIAIGVLQLSMNIAGAPLGRSEKIAEIKKILNSERYKKAFSQLEFKYFPLHWKLYFRLAKVRNATGVYELTKVILKLK